MIEFFFRQLLNNFLILFFQNILEFLKEEKI